MYYKNFQSVVYVLEQIAAPRDKSLLKFENLCLFNTAPEDRGLAQNVACVTWCCRLRAVGPKSKELETVCNRLKSEMDVLRAQVPPRIRACKLMIQAFLFSRLRANSLIDFSLV